MIGVNILNGPQDWEIIGQEEGFAVLELSMRYIINDEASLKGEVYVRVADEETNAPVVFWTKATRTGENADGSDWEITLKVPAGGLYRIETGFLREEDHHLEWLRRGDMRHHIGVGDLYIIAGQSNSAGYGKDAISDAPQLGVHLLKNSHKWDLASHPMNDSTNTAHICNTEGSNPGTNPYLSFAKLLKKEMGYPIGLIQASLGGCALSTWEQDTNGVLYNSMLETTKLIKGKIKGVLWYQGCSDTTDDLACTYYDRFVKVYNQFKRDYGEDIQILTIQLNRHTNNVENENWGIVKDAQRRLAKDFSNIHIVTTTDLPLCDSIHNSSASNLVIGERLARAALGNIYHKKEEFKPANILKATYENEILTLYFENVYDRLFSTCENADFLDFTITDDKGVVEIESFVESIGNEYKLKLKRKLENNAVISGSLYNNTKRFLPVDSKTFMPILAFYKVSI